MTGKLATWRTLGVVIAVAAAMPAYAAPVVDGTLSAGEYGPATAFVAYDPSAPESNFGGPTSKSDAIGYSIYLNDTAGSLYGLLQTNPAGGGTAAGAFANLYFDLDPQNSNGSDLGFEVGNQRAFIPGINGYAPTPEVTFATSADGGTFEFSIPNYDFSAPIAGLNYYPGQVFPDAANPTVVLRLSQSFGYSVAGGDTYGPNRLGSFNVPVNAPEPASLTLFGVALAGIAVLRRRKTVT
jgi:hypothetical protein